MARVASQIAKEFWLPFVVATFWTTWMLWGQNKDAKVIIANFGPAFFLTSWLTGQFFRVRKQVGVEGSLEKLESRLETLVEKLETQTKELVSHVTGGNSWCYIGVGPVNAGGECQWTVIHQGSYTIYQATLRIVDLDQMAVVADIVGDRRYETSFDIGDLPKNTAKTLLACGLGEGDSRRFNLFFMTRSTFFQQELRFRKVNGQWLNASRVTGFGEEPMRIDIPKNFPRGEDGEPNWL